MKDQEDQGVEAVVVPVSAEDEGGAGGEEQLPPSGDLAAVSL